MHTTLVGHVICILPWCIWTLEVNTFSSTPLFICCFFREGNGLARGLSTNTIAITSIHVHFALTDPTREKTEQDRWLLRFKPFSTFVSRCFEALDSQVPPDSKTLFALFELQVALRVHGSRVSLKVDTNSKLCCAFTAHSHHSKLTTNSYATYFYIIWHLVVLHVSLGRWLVSYHAKRAKAAHVSAISKHQVAT